MGGLTMTKYIECKAVFALIRPDDPNDERCAVTVATAKRLIRHALAVAPAADVAPVTRCKDCKYRERPGTGRTTTNERSQIMSINVKKYTKDQMAKMVEDSQAEVQELRRVNAALTEQIDQMNGEAINRENVIADLKADADALRNKLADTEAALGRANSEMAVLRHDLTCEKESTVYLTSVCRWVSGHPWWNLWAWVKRKLKMA